MKFVKFLSILSPRNFYEERILTGKVQPAGEFVDICFSEKIHGANGSVAYNDQDGLYCQSRNNIISLEDKKTLFNISGFVNDRKNEFMGIINQLKDEYVIDTTGHTIALFFEICGANIQRKSACSGLDKRCIIFQYFGVMVDSSEEKLEPEKQWFQTRINSTKRWVDSPEVNIFNIMNLNCFNFKLEWSEFERDIKTIKDFVEENEHNSIVGEVFGVRGNVLEGYVGTFVDKTGKVQFIKVKGENDTDGYDTDGYDSDGYDTDGYDSDRYDSNGYDRDGYDRNGYGRDGFNRDGGYLYTIEYYSIFTD